MIDEELRKAREASIEAHMHGETLKTLEMVMATMPEPTYDLITIGRVLRGDEVGRYLQNSFDALGPWRHRADRIWHSGDEAVVECATIFPDGIDGKSPGEEFEYRSVTFFSFNGPTMASERHYASPETILPLLEGV